MRKYYNLYHRSAKDYKRLLQIIICQQIVQSRKWINFYKWTITTREIKSVIRKLPTLLCPGKSQEQIVLLVNSTKILKKS